MISRLFALLCRIGPLKRLLWRSWYQFLAARYQVREWQVMNYGYTPLPATTPLPLDPADEPERYGLQLYHFVTSAVPLEGSKLLEIGCGRGGGAFHLHRSRQPASTLAVDYSAEAVALCQQRYQYDGLTFAVADAEHLPFASDSFDAVVNIESSHCYSSMERFLQEVKRVLKPDGHFLYADFHDTEKLEQWRDQLTGSGLSLVQETNITPNVLAALDADHERKLELMQKIIPQALLPSFSDFAGVKGSLVYEEFRSGRMMYGHFVMQKV